MELNLEIFWLAQELNSVTICSGPWDSVIFHFLVHTHLCLISNHTPALTLQSAHLHSHWWFFLSSTLFAMWDFPLVFSPAFGSNSAWLWPTCVIGLWVITLSLTTTSACHLLGFYFFYPPASFWLVKTLSSLLSQRLHTFIQPPSQHVQSELLN